MQTVRKSLIFLILASFGVLRPAYALASSYKQAAEAYADQKFSRSYKKAMSVAREEDGTKKGRALMLAAAAVLELDREDKARALFKKAREEDPAVDLPDIVRSKRAIRFFEDLRQGKERVERVEPGNAFDRFDTYLPFGINQLVQEKYGLGLTLGAGQGVAIYNAYRRYTDADRVDRNVIKVSNKALQTGDDINPIYQEYVSKNRAYSRNAREEGQLSVAVAVLTYVGSVMEAGLNPPAAKIHYAFQIQPDQFHMQIALRF